MQNQNVTQKMIVALAASLGIKMTLEHTKLMQPTNPAEDRLDTKEYLEIDNTWYEVINDIVNVECEPIKQSNKNS